jgi:DNA-binding YbaB/EbfC family protein
MKDLNDILGMASRVQEEMQKAQAELDNVEVEGVSGGGLVKVRASAKGRIIALDVAESLIDPKDKTMLEDLIVAAFNDARAKADETAQAQMSKMASGIPLPPGFKLPF